MAYEKESRVALDAAMKAGWLIKHIYVNGCFDVKKKSDSSPVTEADIGANKIIVEAVRNIFPSDVIVSEEMERSVGFGSRVWYIDPLDGTKSFVQRADTFAVHIGLAVDGKPVMGVVHKPLTGESYHGIVGEGAWRLPYGGPETRADIDLGKELDGLVAVVEKKRTDYETHKELFDRMGVTGYMFTGSEGLRVMKVVDGLAHFRLGSKNANVWDVCAPQAVLEAAGGVVSYADAWHPVLYGLKQRLERPVIYARDQKTMDLVKMARSEFEREKYEPRDE
jgi:3'(2'), 5'-bisphosphate nucleotidase